MSLRIIGGKWGNRYLKTPKGPKTRPTSSMLRKAVFDICQFYIEDAEFLDIFAGSGAIGIEALSRGASHATFIDQDKYALKCIHENIEDLDAKKLTTVLAGDAALMLKRLMRQKKSFDMIYIDPPYGQQIAEPLLEMIDQSELLKVGGSVFIEENAPIKNIHLQKLKAKETRKYGKSILHQYEYNS